MHTMNLHMSPNKVSAVMKLSHFFVTALHVQVDLLPVGNGGPERGIEVASLEIFPHVLVVPLVLLVSPSERS
jgi:hypothetical protein